MFLCRWRANSGEFDWDCLSMWTERLCLRPVSKILGFRRGQPLFQGPRAAIFLREQSIGDRPFDPNLRIVPPNPRFSSWIVDSRALVLDFRAIGECTESAREALGRPHHPAVFRRSFDAEPLSQRGRTLPDIDSNQERRTRRNPHELSNWRVPLEMQSADHSLG